VRSLEEVLVDMRARGHTLVEIVTQDEYTHDVVVRAEGERHLVYDTT
jgi:hypothetical protein